MKDPAVLLYVDTWLAATKKLKGNEKGWYLNLILFQYSEGSIPNDIEEIANICDVRISEYDLFKQVWEQVLKQKFKQNDQGRLENDTAKEILRKREQFIDKRKKSGILGYVIKFAIANFKVTPKIIEHIKSTLNIEEIDIKNEQVLKQMLEQNIKLYINGDGDGNKDSINNKKGVIKSLCQKERFDLVLVAFEKWRDYMLKSHSKTLQENEYTYDILIDAIHRVKDGNLVKSIDYSIAGNCKKIYKYEEEGNKPLAHLNQAAKKDSDYN